MDTRRVLIDMRDGAVLVFLPASLYGNATCGWYLDYGSRGSFVRLADDLVTDLLQHQYLWLIRGGTWLAYGLSEAGMNAAQPTDCPGCYATQKDTNNPHDYCADCYAIWQADRAYDEAEGLAEYFEGWEV